MGHALIYIFMKLAEVEKLMVAATGGWYRRLVMVERILVAMKKMRHMVSLCVRYLATCISNLVKRG